MFTVLCHCLVQRCICDASGAFYASPLAEDYNFSVTALASVTVFVLYACAAATNTCLNAHTLCTFCAP